MRRPETQADAEAGNMPSRMQTPSEAHPPPGRAGAQGEIELNDFDRRQTDTGVLMLLKTSKLVAEYAARRLRL